MSPKKRKKRKTLRHKNRKVNRKKITDAERPSISLSMIVKDEEKFLEDCLQSVQDLVNEIVIVDTGSADRTIEIADKFNARVFNYKWKDDFAAARNFALQKCSCPWILYLDADERLHGEFHKIILESLSSQEADAFYLKVYSDVSGVLGNVPHIQAYPRLFKRLPGIRFEGKIHEQITPSLKRINARFKYIDVTIEHLGYAQEDDILKLKIGRNLNYLNDQIKNEPSNAYAWFQLGQTYILYQEPDKGKECLRKALDLNTLPDNLTATIYLTLANEHFKKDEYETALQLTGEALKIAPRQKLGYFLQSECLAKLGKWQEAVTSLNRLVENSDRPFSDISIEKTFENHLIDQRMALYLFNSEDFVQSYHHFNKYLMQAPKLKSSLLNKWAYCYKTVNDSDTAVQEILELFQQNIQNFDDISSAAKILAGVAEEAGNKKLMKNFLEIFLKQNPHDAHALFYLGNLAMENNDLESAESYLTEALENDDDVWEIHYNLAVVKIKGNQFNEAIRILEKAGHKFQQHRLKINRLIGGLYAKLGQYEKVMEFTGPANPT